MIRTQVQLTEEQARKLKRVASERGLSMAEVIRQAIDQELGRDEREARWERAMSVIGKFRGGGGNVAEEHDEYLADAFDQ